MLIGRASECARVDELLGQARGAVGGTLLLRGEPGIGKTALLSYATSAASGCTVLRATGIEAEASGAYAGLADLLGPALVSIDRLSTAQGRRLDAALGRSDDVAPDPAAVAASAFALVAELAVDGPVLVTVDDLPWLDDASREVVLFLARRSDLGGFACLLTARDTDADGLNLGGIDELRLSGLDSADAAVVIEMAASLVPSAEVARKLVEQTGGNPLALAELGRALPTAQLSGAEPLSNPLPAGAAARLFAAVIDALDSHARDATVIAAASDRREVGVLSAAAAELGVELDAFERAEAAGVVEIEIGELTFRHPLLRSVALERAAPARRRAVHRALAAVETDPERRARHLALAAVRPDETVAQALEQAAAAARRRGALSAASGSLALAARLTPADADRAPRLLAAADAAHRAGRWSSASTLAEQAIAASDDLLLQADAALLKGEALHMTDRPEAGAALLIEYAERVSGTDRRRATRLLSDAVGAWFSALKFDRALETAERCLELADATERTTVHVQLAIGNALGNMGRAGEAARWQADAAATVASVDDLLSERLTGSAATAFGHLERYDRARSLLSRWGEQARRAGALAVLMEVLDLATTNELLAGEWPAAAVNADEGARLAADLGQPVLELWSRVMRAQIAAGQGDEFELETQLSVASDLAAGTGMRGVVDYYAALARGNALLATGEYELAASTLALLEGLDSTAGASSFSRWLPDYAEALRRAERPEDARKVLRRFARLHQDSGQRWAAAAIARLRGLVEDRYDQHFERAVKLGPEAQNAFETARTALAYGERLRRDGERRRARAMLGDALATFVRVGARTYAERAQAELRASGQTRAAHRALDSPLTPSEQQVAELVAEGLSNREIASRLFVSVRTVEMHISRAYRKLGIRSRTGLARHVLTGAGVGELSVGETVSA